MPGRRIRRKGTKLVSSCEERMLESGGKAQYMKKLTEV
jgi:hypothetical protein